MKEFDLYSDDYEKLVTDPVRTRFGGGNSDFFHARKMDLLLRFCSRHGRDTSQMAWLDVGCGRGELLELGRNKFRQRAGCDPSAGMLTNVSQALDVRQQTAPTVIPFPSASFDLVTAVCVYHHVEPHDRLKLTSEILRVLKPEGLFVMIEHNPWNPVTRLVVRRVPVDKNAQLLSATLAKSVIANAGLRPLRIEYFLFFPKVLYRYLRLVEDILNWLPIGGQYAAYASKH